jgi:hypothetical protein
MGSGVGNTAMSSMGQGIYFATIPARFGPARQPGRTTSHTRSITRSSSRPRRSFTGSASMGPAVAAAGSSFADGSVAVGGPPYSTASSASTSRSTSSTVL